MRLKILNNVHLRGEASAMFSCTEQLNGTKESESLRDPGPDDSHLCPCHNTGVEGAKVYHLDRLPVGTYNKKQETVMIGFKWEKCKNSSVSDKAGQDSLMSLLFLVKNTRQIQFIRYTVF